MHRASTRTASDHHPSLSIVLAGMSCAIAIAACGGSGARPSAASTPYGPKNSPASVSRCMRAHGLSNFPDPVAGPGGEGFPEGLMVSSNGSSLTVDGTSFSGPALKSAEKACQEFLPPGGPPPALSESQKLAALRFARCMRAHGVPDFPDPTFWRSGGQQIVIGPGSSQSPAFQHAAAACGPGRF